MRPSARRCLGVTLALAVAIVAGACSTPTPIPAVDVRAAFDATLVAHGEQLAAVGNCITCHSVPGQPAYSGGFPVRTPFGTVYGTNLTPDAETGLGRWSEEAFRRALREGVGRDGRHLYPAFPYDHFALLTDADVHALYAFLMTREPVRRATPANDVWIPRPLVAAWKALYLRPDSGPADRSPPADPGLARGRYLADGLAHCGACHTPRNALGAEKKDRAFDGADVEGWHAPALNARSTSPVPWTVESLNAYLRDGIAEGHAVSAGPMRGVTGNLAAAAPEDVAAIAAYVVSLDNRDAAARDVQARAAVARDARAGAPATGSGALLYAGACAQCHDRGRHAEGGALQLTLAIAPALPTPANLIRIVREGIQPAAHERFPWMPGYDGAFTDEQLAELVAYVRTFSGLPPWTDVIGAVKATNRVAQ
jgi:mono/diheme cytochrome c family protein